MHLLVRETRTLDEAAAAVDPGLSSAELVFLSFSDSDLGAWSAAWQEGKQDAGLPSLRLASLAGLRHPMSVDLLVEQVIAKARCVVIRLLGGLDYWRYGVEEVAALCRSQGIALAVLPGDGPDDPRLADFSTVSPARRIRLDGFLREGGPRNAACALRLAAHLAGSCDDEGAEPEPLAEAGLFALPGLDPAHGPLAVIVFYRSHLLCGDTEPVTALAAALRARGLGVRAIYVSSLKQPDAAAYVEELLLAWRPAVVLSATAFSARRGAARGSPLDRAGVPVLQLVLAVGGRSGWADSARGLSQTDLAMQVVLPELDGRLLATAVSFKAAEPAVGALEFARTLNRADPALVELAADRAAGWAGLAAAARADRRVGVILSDYPGIGGQVAHAVGLDGFASLRAILGPAAGCWIRGATSAGRLDRGALPRRARAVPFAGALRRAAGEPAGPRQPGARRGLGRSRR